MRFIKKQLRALLQRNLVHLYKYQAVPVGLSLALDVKRARPDFKIRVLFDVGANIGQSTAAYLRDFREAQIHSFEPALGSFATLQERFKNEPRVRCVNLALGSQDGIADLVHTASSTRFYVPAPGKIPGAGGFGKESETVTVSTLDSYCKQTGIERIDFLKIDTEGHDLDVLKGAAHLLARGGASFVQCECGMNPTNKFHQPFEKITQYLEEFGYYIFGIYTQAREFDGALGLRRSDVVYVSSRLWRNTGDDPARRMDEADFRQ